LINHFLFLSLVLLRLYLHNPDVRYSYIFFRDFVSFVIRLNYDLFDLYFLLVPADKSPPGNHYPMYYVQSLHTLYQSEL